MSLVCDEVLFNFVKTLLQELRHHFKLAADQPEVRIFAADEAQDQVVYRFGDVLHVVGRDEECLQGVVLEGFGSELDVLVADVGEHCRLGVHFLVFPCLGDNGALDVAEKTKEG